MCGMKVATPSGQSDRVRVSSVPVDLTAGLAYGSEVPVIVDEFVFLDMVQTEFVKARCKPASMPRARARRRLHRKQSAPLVSDHKRAVQTFECLRDQSETFLSAELKDKLPREQPLTSGQKRRWKSFAIGNTPGARRRLESNPTTLGFD